MSTSGGLGSLYSSVPRLHSSHDSGAMLSKSLGIPHVPRNSSRHPPTRLKIPYYGSHRSTRSPKGLARSTVTSIKLPTLLPTEVDALFASADGSLNPPTPVDGRACSCWWGFSISRSPGHSSSKNDCASVAPGSSRMCSYARCARCLPSCMLRRMYPCPWHARGSWLSVRGMRSQ